MGKIGKGFIGINVPTPQIYPRVTSRKVTCVGTNAGVSPGNGEEEADSNDSPAMYTEETLARKRPEFRQSSGSRNGVNQPIDHHYTHIRPILEKGA